jgi:hypothetical protein
VVVTFDLERFEWAAPDRLQVAGTFDGLDEAAAGPPMLVLRAADRTHRLPAAGRSGVPADGKPWMATFAWREAPEPFHSAELQLGGDIAVELPEPGAAQPGHRLEVRQPAAPAPSAPVNGVPAVAPRAAEPSAAEATERLRLQGDLLTAQEEAREARALADRAMEELSRAHQDLDTEREGRAADAERFRDGLATVRASAEEALAAEQQAVAQLRAPLQAAEAARAEAQAGVAALQERLETLEEAQQEHERMRAEVELARVQTEAARSRRTDAHAQIGQAREEVEGLLERLKAIHDTLDDAG